MMFNKKITSDDFINILKSEKLDGIVVSKAFAMYDRYGHTVKDLPMPYRIEVYDIDDYMHYIVHMDYHGMAIVGNKATFGGAYPEQTHLFIYNMGEVKTILDLVEEKIGEKLPEEFEKFVEEKTKLNDLWHIR